MRLITLLLLVLLPTSARGSARGNPGGDNVFHRSYGGVGNANKPKIQGLEMRRAARRHLKFPVIRHALDYVDLASMLASDAKDKEKVEAKDKKEVDIRPQALPKDQKNQGDKPSAKPPNLPANGDKPIAEPPNLPANGDAADGEEDTSENPVVFSDSEGNDKNIKLPLIIVGVCALVGGVLFIALGARRRMNNKQDQAANESVALNSAAEDASDEGRPMEELSVQLEDISERDESLDESIEPYEYPEERFVLQVY